MTTIAKDAAALILINTFHVTPGKQQALIDLLDKATNEIMRKQPGFISANIHRSLDGTKVANYAQWRSKADFEEMQNNPEASVHMKEAAALADRFEPVLRGFKHPQLLTYFLSHERSRHIWLNMYSLSTANFELINLGTFENMPMTMPGRVCGNNSDHVESRIVMPTSF